MPLEVAVVSIPRIVSYWLLRSQDSHQRLLKMPGSGNGMMLFPGRGKPVPWNIPRHKFSPTRSVTSGNRTPGSRSTSALCGYLDRPCSGIYQLVLKPCSKSASTMARSNYCTVALRIHSSSQDTLRIGYTSLFCK